MKFAVAIILTATLFSSVLSAKQYITLYTDLNQRGENLTLDTHYANLSEHKDFLREASSFCAVGWIAFFTQVDYNLEGGIAFLIDHSDDEPLCGNRIFSNFNSMRYMGNKDTDLQGLSLYSKANYHGTEVFVDESGTLSGPITFPVFSLVSTGWGNYTFYDDVNQTGNAWCSRSTDKIHMEEDIQGHLSIIHSVAVGCN